LIYKSPAIALSLAMVFIPSQQNWFFRYKLYHLPFWTVYNYIWWAIFLGQPIHALHEMFLTAFSVKFFFYVFMETGAVYFNLYFLIPRVLQKGRYTAYISYLILTILITALLIVPGYYISAFFYGGTVKSVYGVSGPYPYLQLFKENPIQSTIASTTLAMSIKLTKTWLQSQRRQQALEKEKLETELKFLKYQFNPHFLFNSINSIFFLIHKNPDVASASLAKFSELLRHHLYECNDLQIPLTKEIAYLENFIELEKLRQNPDLEVCFVTEGDYPDSLGIAPFILMTFVENAFKHVSKHKGNLNWINIYLTINDKQLNVNISNSTAPDERPEVVNYGGIGLKNVQRRLDLIYPEQYKLTIQNNPENFVINFSLQLSELEVNRSIQLMA
jgi:sensor histidine kinase YesM